MLCWLGWLPTKGRPKRAWDRALRTAGSCICVLFCPLTYQRRRAASCKGRGPLCRTWFKFRLPVYSWGPWANYLDPSVPPRPRSYDRSLIPNSVVKISEITSVKCVVHLDAQIKGRDCSGLVIDEQQSTATPEPWGRAKLKPVGEMYRKLSLLSS